MNFPNSFGNGDVKLWHIEKGINKMDDSDLYKNPNAGELATEYYTYDPKWGTSRPNGSGDPVDDEEDYDDVETPQTALSVALSLTSEPLTMYTVTAMPSRLLHPRTDWFSLPSMEELDLLNTDEIGELIDNYMEMVFGVTKMMRFHSNHEELALNFLIDPTQILDLTTHRSSSVLSQFIKAPTRSSKTFSPPDYIVSDDSCVQKFLKSGSKANPRKCKMSQSFIQQIRKNSTK